MDLIGLCLKLSFVGALLWLDRMYAFQLMISRPVVAGPLVGLCLGNPGDGLVVGVLLELLWAHYLPVGSTAPPDETVLAVLVTATGALGLELPRSMRHADILYGLAVFLPMAYVFQRLDMRLRKANSRLNRVALEAVRRRDYHALERTNWGGLLLAWPCAFLTLLAASFLLLNLIRWSFPMLPDVVLRTLHVMVYMVPVVGVASALSSTVGFQSMSLLVISFLFFLLVFR